MVAVVVVVVVVAAGVTGVVAVVVVVVVLALLLQSWINLSALCPTLRLLMWLICHCHSDEDEASDELGLLVTSRRTYKPEAKLNPR